MKVEETMIGNGVIVELTKLRGMGTNIDMYLPISVKIIRSKGFTRRISFQTFSIKWMGQTRC